MDNDCTAYRLRHALLTCWGDKAAWQELQGFVPPAVKAYEQRLVQALDQLGYYVDADNDELHYKTTVDVSAA